MTLFDFENDKYILSNLNGSLRLIISLYFKINFVCYFRFLLNYYLFQINLSHSHYFNFNYVNYPFNFIYFIFLYVLSLKIINELI